MVQIISYLFSLSLIFVFFQTDGASHIATKDYSMADLIFFPHLAMLVLMGLPLDSRPSLKKYHEMVSQRESSKKLMPTHCIWPKNNLFGDV